jgi:hypothetical protein
MIPCFRSSVKSAEKERAAEGRSAGYRKHPPAGDVFPEKRGIIRNERKEAGG